MENSDDEVHIKVVLSDLEGHEDQEETNKAPQNVKSKKISNNTSSINTRAKSRK